MAHPPLLQALLRLRPTPLAQLASRVALGLTQGPGDHFAARCPRWLTTSSSQQQEGGELPSVQSLVQKHVLVNTLQLATRFESAGLDRRQAEALALHITELIVLNKVKMEETFVSRTVLDKLIMEQESKVTGFKTELSKAQDMVQANVNKDLERQQSFLDKMRTEVRHEIDKLSASQRLDMNLEKGRMRDDLLLIRDKTTELEIKVDRDINELKSSVEKAKNDTIKSVITILGTFSAIAFTISRFMQMGG